MILVYDPLQFTCNRLFQLALISGQTERTSAEVRGATDEEQTIIARYPRKLGVQVCNDIDQPRPQGYLFYIGTFI